MDINHCNNMGLVLKSSSMCMAMKRRVTFQQGTTNVLFINNGHKISEDSNLQVQWLDVTKVCSCGNYPAIVGRDWESNLSE